MDFFLCYFSARIYININISINKRLQNRMLHLPLILMYIYMYIKYKCRQTAGEYDNIKSHMRAISTRIMIKTKKSSHQ